MKLRNKKTGEIAEIKLKPNESLPDAIRRTIEEAGWEDTREPLIKDEKIRKAVRAWADVNDVGVAKVAPFAVFDIESSARISFYARVIEDKDYDEKKSYTITELCGEEEE